MCDLDSADARRIIEFKWLQEKVCSRNDAPVFANDIAASSAVVHLIDPPNANHNT